jgi:hypothetical protein
MLSFLSMSNVLQFATSHKASQLSGAWSCPFAFGLRPLLSLFPHCTTVSLHNKQVIIVNSSSSSMLSRKKEKWTLNSTERARESKETACRPPAALKLARTSFLVTPTNPRTRCHAKTKLPEKTKNHPDLRSTDDVCRETAKGLPARPSHRPPTRARE